MPFNAGRNLNHQRWFIINSPVGLSSRKVLVLLGGLLAKAVMVTRALRQPMRGSALPRAGPTQVRRFAKTPTVLPEAADLVAIL